MTTDERATLADSLAFDTPAHVRAALEAIARAAVASGNWSAATGAARASMDLFAVERDVKRAEAYRRAALATAPPPSVAALEQIERDTAFLQRSAALLAAIDAARAAGDDDEEDRLAREFDELHRAHGTLNDDE